MNRRLIQESTSIAQWYELVNEAQAYLGKRLEIDLESYLVFLLQRFTNRPDLTQSILALEYLESLESSGKQQVDRLRDIGDKCVIFTGFFPEIAGKRHVTVSYFVDIGRRAYSYLSLQHRLGALTTELYELLRLRFIQLVDLLFSIRELSGEKDVLSLLHAEDLWRHSGSQYAYKVLKKYNKKIIAINQGPSNLH